MAVQPMAAAWTASRATERGGDITPRWRAVLPLLILLSVGPSACSPPLHSSPAPVAEGVTNEQRIAAMLSIHAHARWPDGNFDGLQILPLQKAVEILTRDRGMAADSRRRRAIAKLKAYAPGNEDARRAIDALLMNRQDITSKLSEARTAGGRSVSPAILEVAIVNSLATVTPDCQWKVPAPSGGVADPPPVQWSYDVFVPRPVNDIARALDPQSWDLCSPFFTDTHLASTAGPCCPASPAASCSETGKRSEPAGKPYAAVLYEHFCIADDCSSPCPGPHRCNIDFENLLCVTTEYTPGISCSLFAACADRYDVDFDLASGISGELLGVEPAPLITDEGHVSARRATAAETATLSGSPWALVHVDKTLGFANPGQTGAVGKFLQILTDELAGQIVEQACCAVPPECWCAGW